jgi:hypothetical protein
MKVASVQLGCETGMGCRRACVGRRGNGESRRVGLDESLGREGSGIGVVCRGGTFTVLKDYSDVSAFLRDFNKVSVSSTFLRIVALRENDHDEEAGDRMGHPDYSQVHLPPVPRHCFSSPGTSFSAFS